VLVIAGAPFLGSCGATLPWNAGPSCQKSAVHTELHIEPSDPRQIWGTDLETEHSVVVRPRSDTTWRIEPARDNEPNRLVDGSGRTWAWDGDIFYEACIDAVTGTYYVGPDDLPGPRGAT
jgi:hypothetical protein